MIARIRQYTKTPREKEINNLVFLSVLVVTQLSTTQRRPKLALQPTTRSSPATCAVSSSVSVRSGAWNVSA